MTDMTGILALFITLLFWGIGIALIVYFFNRLNKIISLLEEIKEQGKSRD